MASSIQRQASNAGGITMGIDLINAAFDGHRMAVDVVYHMLSLLMVSTCYLYPLA